MKMMKMVQKMYNGMERMKMMNRMKLMIMG